MKKFFLFAAAVVAAMCVNAKVIDFTNIVDKTSADAAKATFEAAYDLSNITITGKANSDKTAYYAEVKQTSKTTEWGVTTAKLKSDAQAYFDFKDGNDNKVVAKAWADYMQPNGKAMCLVVANLTAGQKVKLTLKSALSVAALVEGAEVIAEEAWDETEVELTAADTEIRVYSKTADNGDAKWKLVSVEIVEGAQGIEDVLGGEKAVKTVENGQLVIIKNGVKFNALGAKL